MSEMSPRERFKTIMPFQLGVRTLNWEFSHWVAAVERWYGEGLRRSSLALVPGLPAGSMVYAEALLSPNASIQCYRPQTKLVEFLAGITPRLRLGTGVSGLKHYGTHWIIGHHLPRHHSCG
jgi:hypothetical protein